MKVTVCFGGIWLTVPCGDGDMTVGQVAEAALKRYRKATGKSDDSWVTVHNLKSLADGGILDRDDKLAAVCDDKDQILAIYDEQEPARSHLVSAPSPVGRDTMRVESPNDQFSDGRGYDDGAVENAVEVTSFDKPLPAGLSILNTGETPTSSSSSSVTNAPRAVASPPSTRHSSKTATAPHDHTRRNGDVNAFDGRSNYKTSLDLTQPNGRHVISSIAPVYGPQKTSHDHHQAQVNGGHVISATSPVSGPHQTKQEQTQRNGDVILKKSQRDRTRSNSDMTSSSGSVEPHKTPVNGGALTSLFAGIPSSQKTTHDDQQRPNGGSVTSSTANVPSSQTTTHDDQQRPNGGPVAVTSSSGLYKKKRQAPRAPVTAGATLTRIESVDETVTTPPAEVMAASTPLPHATPASNAPALPTTAPPTGMSKFIRSSARQSVLADKWIEAGHKAEEYAWKNEERQEPIGREQSPSCSDGSAGGEQLVDVLLTHYAHVQLEPECRLNGRIRMAALPDDDFLVRQLQALDIDENWSPEEDYYVHIDVLHGCSQLVARRINAHMLRGDAFDPRLCFNFPTDLMLPPERDTLKRRRQLACIGVGRYEFWKVRRNFSLPRFREMVQSLPAGVKVRIVRMIDNDHDINVYDGGPPAPPAVPVANPPPA